jgi:hypothetical protein
MVISAGLPASARPSTLGTLAARCRPRCPGLVRHPGGLPGGGRRRKRRELRRGGPEPRAATGGLAVHALQHVGRGPFPAHRPLRLLPAPWAPAPAGQRRVPARLPVAGRFIGDLLGLGHTTLADTYAGLAILAWVSALAAAMLLWRLAADMRRGAPRPCRAHPGSLRSAALVTTSSTDPSETGPSGVGLAEVDQRSTARDQLRILVEYQPKLAVDHGASA